MNISRRNFFGLVGGAAAAPVAAKLPEMEPPAPKCICDQREFKLKQITIVHLKSDVTLINPTMTLKFATVERNWGAWAEDPNTFLCPACLHPPARQVNYSDASRFKWGDYEDGREIVFHCKADKVTPDSATLTGCVTVGEGTGGLMLTVDALRADNRKKVQSTYIFNDQQVFGPLPEGDETSQRFHVMYQPNNIGTKHPTFRLFNGEDFY